jgi:hypothetical protein
MALNACISGFSEEKSMILSRLESENLISIVADLELYMHLIHQSDSSSYIIFDNYCSNDEYVIPYDLYSKLFNKYFILFLANMSRNNSYTGRHTDYIDAIYQFRLMISAIYNILIKNKVQIFITLTMPHEIIDTLCYILAKELQILTLLLISPEYNNDCFFALLDMNDYGIFSNKKQIRPYEPCSINKFTDNLFNGLTLAQHAHDFRDKRFNSVMRNKQVQSYNFYCYQEYVKDKLNITYLENIPEKYIYFPLHFQPEASIIAYSPLEFDNQILCLEYLSQKLPDKYTILVKENPGQFFFHRTNDFYRKCQKIPKVRFISENTDSLQLIKQSSIVSTVRGTAGWEALKYGKPVVYFGNALYREMPGAFKYSLDLDIEYVLQYKVKLKEVEVAIGKLLSTAYAGTLLMPSENEDMNVEICVHSISKIINDTCNSSNYVESYNNMITQHYLSTANKNFAIPQKSIQKYIEYNAKYEFPFCKRTVFRALLILERCINNIRLRLMTGYPR